MKALKRSEANFGAQSLRSDRSAQDFEEAVLPEFTKVDQLYYEEVTEDATNARMKRKKQEIRT